MVTLNPRTRTRLGEMSPLSYGGSSADIKRGL